jgi:hypothetical protein
MRWRLSGTGWQLAASLQTLAHQINDVWPEGGPADGTIGDAAHRTRRSDHNPSAAGLVAALDVDEVVEGRGQKLVDELVRSKDQRIKYIIHEGKIWRSYARTGTTPWVPSAYTGSNPHDSHVHISVILGGPRADRQWAINLEGGDGLSSISVKEWQSILNAAGVTDLNGRSLVEDGVYGEKTRSALLKLARGSSLDVGAHNHNSLYALKDHPHTIT